MSEKISSACSEFLAVLEQEVVQPLRERNAAEGGLAGGDGPCLSLLASGSPADAAKAIAVTGSVNVAQTAGVGDAAHGCSSLAEAFAALPDPRREHLRVHSLASLLLVAVAAMLTGAKSLSAIGQWAAERRQDAPPLLERLGVKPGRCPSVSTLHRVFKRLDAPAVLQAAGNYLLPGEPAHGVTIGIDGKTARGTIPRGKHDGVHLVSASVVQTNTVLAQAACPGKGHELATGRKVLQGIPKEGNLIIGDALYLQRDICTYVVEQGGDYLFPVKENQPQLLADIQRAGADLPVEAAPKLPQRVGNWFSQPDLRWRHTPLPPEQLPDPLLPAEWQRGLERQGIRVTVFLEAPCKPAHGRFERRELWAIYHPELNKHAGEAGEAGAPWPYLQQVCWIKRERVTPEYSSVEVTCAATSMGPAEADAARIAQELRGYWGGVENRLHGVRDVTLGEDASPVRTGAAPEVMAVLRSVMLGLLRHCGIEHIAEKIRSLAPHSEKAVELVLNTGSP